MNIYHSAISTAHTTRACPAGRPRRSITLLPLATAAVLSLSLLTSCGPKETTEQREITRVLVSEDRALREDSFQDAQAALSTDESENASKGLLKGAGRKRSKSGGLIREPIDFSDSTIRYFRTDFSEILSTSSADQASGKALEIVDFGPSGKLPVENRRPNIYVMFNQPMVPLAQLGKPITESDILAITPPVEGVYRWYGTKTLGFRPNRHLLDVPRYTVRIAADSRSLSGQFLKKAFSFDIIGEPVEMVNMFPGNDADNTVGVHDVPTTMAREITLEFSQPVDLEHIAKFIDIKNFGEMKFTATRPNYPPRLSSRTERGILLTLEREPEVGSVLQITLDKGASAFPGYPQTPNSQSYKLNTYKQFKATRLEVSASGFPRDGRNILFPVTVLFNYPLDDESRIDEIGAKVDGQDVQVEDISVSRFGVNFYLKNILPGMRVSVTVPPGTMRDVYGRENTNTVLNATIPRPRPFLQFPYARDGLVHLEAEFSPALLWLSRNIVRGKLGVNGRDNFFGQPSYHPPLSEFDFSSMKPDITHYHEQDLKPYLSKAGYGTVYLHYDMYRDPTLEKNEDRRRIRDVVAVQVTDLGLTVRVAYNRILVWVNRLSNGEAVGNAEISVFNSIGADYSGTTDAEGLAVIPLESGDFARYFRPSSWDNDKPLYVRAVKDADLVEMKVVDNHDPYSFGIYNTIVTRRAEGIKDRVHMFTDRGLYKGAEELAVRGVHWLQSPEGYESYRGPYHIKIIESATDKEIWSAADTTSGSGGFHHRLRLPENLEPGGYRIAYQAGQYRKTIGFRIAAFRRLNFQVDSRILTTELFHGDDIEAHVNASSLAGSALSNADYHYFWTRNPTRFHPPGNEWKDWVFGTSAWAAEQTLSSGDGILSEDGSARITEDTTSHEVSGKAYRYFLETSVEDIDRQVVSSLSSVLVHPASYYIGARFAHGSVDGWWSRFVSTDSDLAVQARLVDIDGSVPKVSGVLKTGLVKEEWKQAKQQGIYGRVNVRWERVETEIWQEEKTFRKSTLDMKFRVDDPGSYTLYFEYNDAEGRLTRTEIEFYATGSGWVEQASRSPSEIKLLVDRELYEVGETARVLVQSPLPRGRYLLTMEREGILDERVIALEGSNEIIEIPIQDEFLPVFYVALSSFTERTDTENDYFKPDLGRPRGLFGITTVNVATTPMELDVTVKALKESYRPGDEAEIEVKVGHRGRPLADAEVTLMAVDRGVLDLIDYHIPNPVDYFYNRDKFPLGVMGDDSRRLLVRPVTYELSELRGGDATKLEERRDFNPLALFEPSARTGADGTVRLKAKLPDTLSTYRLTAVALHGVKLGIDENEFQVNNPVNVRSALPRLFRVRDSAAAGVILTNTTDNDVLMNVSVESDVLDVVGENTRKLTLPPGTAIELPFVMEARRKGEGVIRFTMRSSVLNEILEEKVSVQQPIVTEAFTTIGIVNSIEGATEELVIPPYSAEDWGGLSLAVDTSLYPYIEETINRLQSIPYPSLHDRLYNLSADLVEMSAQGASDKSLFKRAESTFQNLAAYQFKNGGIGFRSPTLQYAEPSLFLSILSAHTIGILDTLISEDNSDFENPIDTANLFDYLRIKLKVAARDNDTSFLAVWNAQVLAENAKLTPSELDWLRDAGDKLGVAGYNLLARAYAAMGRTQTATKLYQRSKNFITIGTQSIDIVDTHERDSYFSNNIVELATFLRSAALLGEDRELQLRIAGTLDDRRNARRFQSYFDDFWVVNALLPLIAEAPASREVRLGVSLDGKTLIDRVLSGGNTLREGFPLEAEPLSTFEKNRPLMLKLESRESTSESGDLYYAATLRYALPVETALPRDEGIEVFSQIETLGGKVLDVTALPLGETLRMRVSISTLSRRSYLKLIVPIPSGAEIVDPSFVTTGSYGDQGGTMSETWTRETVLGDSLQAVAEGYVTFAPDQWYFWFYRPIQSIYDNAITYTWEDFYPGQRDVSFLIRTTTPGIYPTPPVNASLIFEPEVFGRGPGKLAVIQGE